MSEQWSLPGYDVEQLLGFGATGEVWRAREQATNDVVALKRLRPGVDRSAVDVLRREAAVLSVLDTPYVVRLRAVIGDDVDPVLVLDHAAGGSLAGLLTRRGCLTPGEVVSIGAPLAQALATAHARGLVHGDVSPANVLFRADGMPLLSDLGVARLSGDRLADVDGTAEYVDPAVARGGAPDAAADVWALAAVCHHMLAGAPPHEGESVDAVLSAAAKGGRAPLGLLAPDAPRPLVAAIEAGLVADPAERPSAAAFAAVLRRAHATAPVRLTGTAAAAPAGSDALLAQVRPTHAVRRSPTAPQHAAVGAERWRPPRWALVWAVAVVALAVAATAGWASGRGAAALPALAVVPPTPVVPAPAAGPPVAPPARPDWVAVLTALTDARADAFAAGDAGALLAVYAPQSSALATDSERITDLAAEGRRAHGVRHVVLSVELLSTGADRVRLRVVDELAPYELRDSGGAVVERIPGRPAAASAVDLVETADGWRLSAVEPA